MPANLAAQGAIACASVREIAQQAAIILIMVPDTLHVASVLFDDGGVALGLTAGKIVVDMRRMGLSLPNTAIAQELFNSCAAHGGKAWDHSALVRALDLMANYEIGAPPPE